MTGAETGALRGVRILDLTWGIAGPLGLWLLAEQGADVIKVEPPGGDPFRQTHGYTVWNRSRRSVSIDLTRPEGIDLLLDLVEGADVLAESFTPGVMDSLGLAYKDLAAINPRLVYLSVPAYPSASRHAHRPGYDALVQARSGQQWEQPGWRPGPTFLHMPMPSMGTALLVPAAVVAALIARQRTGTGQHVETSLYQGALAFTTQIWQWAEHAGAAHHGVMMKTYPPGVHQTSIFECAEDQWIHLCVMNGLTPKRTVEDLLGLPQAPSFAEMSQMSPDERHRIDQSRRDAFRKRARAELLAELWANDISAEAIIPMEEAFSDPQLRANGMVVEVDDPQRGTTLQIGVPIHLQATPGAVSGPQPTPGEHTFEVFGELGYRRDRLEALAAAGVI
jgi:crotonobetainyl-CoA:carnitine CoA-transferase CaiB-like acyl-CoA transferase